MTPFQVTQKHKAEKINVPCGKCYDCRARRASGWSFRLMKESERSSSAYFVTLTYSTENIKLTKNKFMNLNKRDLQLYFKRLRKLNKGIKLKYYAVGEYGEKSNRPHYHIILFNAKYSTIDKAWMLDNKYIGTVHVPIENINEAMVGYTLKYISKPSKVPMHKNDDRLKEFSLMSKGLGENYLTKNIKKWHTQNSEAVQTRQYIVLKGGKKIALPRYYKNKLYNDIQKLQIQIAAQKINSLTQQQLEDEHGDNLSHHLAQIALHKQRKLYGNNYHSFNNILTEKSWKIQKPRHCPIATPLRQSIQNALEARKTLLNAKSLYVVFHETTKNNSLKLSKIYK